MGTGPPLRESFSTNSDLSSRPPHVAPGCRTDSRLVIRRRRGQLAFLGHPFKRFINSFDPVLKLAAIGRKKAHDLVSTYRRQRKSRGAKINNLPDFEFMARHVDLLIHSAWRRVAHLLSEFFMGFTVRAPTMTHRPPSEIVISNQAPTSCTR